MFDNSGVSTSNYEAILTGWSQQTVQPNVALGALGLTYCSGEAARQSLIDTYGWTITDAGRVTLGADCPYVFTNATLQTAVNEWVSNPTIAATTYGDISTWNVSQVTNMSNLFGGTTFNGDISSWDVSSVTNMNEMFVIANKFNQDISGWNVSKVTDMGSMFRNAKDFNQDIGSWDVGKVTNMSGMFTGAVSFNQDLGDWDVSSVTDMHLHLTKTLVLGM
jgi:surface protein